MGMNRRVYVGAMASSVMALAVHATPSFAQSATPTADAQATARAAAVKAAANHRTFFRQQEALDTLKPFIGDNDFDTLIEYGRDLEIQNNPQEKIQAVQYYTQAIALKPTDRNGYIRRAGALGDAGYRYFDRVLVDRQKILDLAEADKSVAIGDLAGYYGDMAGAHSNLIVPRNGTKDLARVDETMKWRSKAIDTVETYGRLLDRAELINSHIANPSAGRDDIDRARYLISVRQTGASPAQGGSLAAEGSPGLIYANAQFKRRVAALSTSMSLAGATITINGIASQYRDSVGQLRNSALEGYSKYIDSWWGTGPDWKNRDSSKWGDIIGAYENRRSVANSLGGSYHQQALKDMQSLIDMMRPKNPAYWRNAGIAIDQLDGTTNSETGVRTSMNAIGYYKKYIELNGPEDQGSVADTLARINM